MKKIRVAVCDTDDIYRERLAEYLIRKKSGQIQTYAFSGKRRLQDQLKTEPVDIILYGRGFEVPEPEQEQDSLFIPMVEERSEVEAEGGIFKYQSAEEILRQMYDCYLRKKQKNLGCSCKTKEIAAVYSPTHCMMQTAFALAMAQILSEEKRVLYLNLGEWSGFCPWMRQEYQRDLADLLYLLSSYGGQRAGLLESVVHSFHRVDYIPPMNDAQLLAQTGAQVYESLLDMLIEKTEYDVILLDFGIMVPGFFSLLERCSSVYGVVEHCPWSRMRWQQFENSLMKQGQEELAGKLECVTLELSDYQMMEEEPVVQQWVNGKFGDRARALRYGNHGTD